MHDGHPAALDDPETRRALARYSRAAKKILLLGFVALLLATVVVSAANGNPSGIANLVALIGFGGGLVPLYAGTVGSLRAWRARRLLARRSWQICQAVYRIAPMGPNGQPALLVAADDSHPETVFSVPTTVWRYRRLHTGIDGTLHIVWGGRRWAVVAPLDHTVVILVKKPWLPLQRMFLRRIVQRA